MPSLWRNGVRLGDVVEAPPEKMRRSSPGSFLGQLKPTAEFAGTKPMMQQSARTIPGFPPIPAFQAVVELDEPPSTARRLHLEKELLPMGEEEAKGVPPDQLFEIRADDGSVINLDLIWLMRHVVPEDVPMEEIRRHLGPDATREAWSVFGQLYPVK